MDGSPVPEQLLENDYGPSFPFKSIFDRLPQELFSHIIYTVFQSQNTPVETPESNDARIRQINATAHRLAEVDPRFDVEATAYLYTHVTLRLTNSDLSANIRALETLHSAIENRESLRSRIDSIRLEVDGVNSWAMSDSYDRARQILGWATNLSYFYVLGNFSKDNNDIWDLIDAALAHGPVLRFLRLSAFGSELLASDVVSALKMRPCRISKLILHDHIPEDDNPSPLSPQVNGPHLQPRVEANNGK